MSGQSNTDLVGLNELSREKKKYLQSRIVKNEYGKSEAADGIIQLIRKYPGEPFGITWNGGIAFTFNDYQYAKDGYSLYREDKDQYESAKLEPRDAPINPQAHMGPLLEK